MTLEHRRPSFPFAADLEPEWSPRRPEFALAANALSLLMPFVEPYIVHSVRSALPDLPDTMRDEADTYVRQEAAHHAQHRRFNDAITGRYPSLRRLERVMRRVYGWLDHTRSRRFNVAFAAGSEAIAFSLARWVERNLTELFTDADPVVRDLFWWHLAEEVEHKSVAFDVYQEIDGSRLRYAAATTLSLVLLGLFTIAGTTTMLVASGRILRPVAWWRITKWAISLAFRVLPDLAASMLPGHHPSDLADPTYLSQWLKGFDPATATAPT